MAKKRIPDHLQLWVDARTRFHLSHAHVQMARELGLNPKNLGKLANDGQEPWKAPLPQFIEHLYQKRFGRDRPHVVQSIEDKLRAERAKKASRQAAKRLAAATPVAIAWYRPEQWDRLRQVSADRDALEASHGEWLVAAEATLTRLQRAGTRVEPVTVDVPELEAWCQAQGVPVDARGRSRYAAARAAELARRRGP